jgi:hypothetical protein
VISNASRIQEELERILATRWLKDSQQLSALLRHIVEETLAGRADGLKEYSLGLQVFHRPPDYDPRTDAIVRVQASLLRKRLAAYYENEGSGSTVRIELPRGGYVPEFREHAEPPRIEPAASPQPPSRRPAFFTGLAAGFALGLAVLFLLRSPSFKPVECPALWSEFLQPRVETVTGFGVPLFFSGGAGFYVRDTQVNRLSDDQSRIDRIGEILGRRFRPQGDVYTGIGDAIGAHLVARWLEQRGVKSTMANCNYIGASDVTGRNLIIVASARFQTLLQTMNLPRRIRFDPGSDAGFFSLENPLPGEQASYAPQGSDTGVSTSYAVISLWPGLPANRRVMYVSGIETWSTQGAAQFALDPDRLAQLQRLLDRDPPNGPRGRKSPFFQVLLRVEGKNNVVRSAHYLTHRYLPQP